MVTCRILDLGIAWTEQWFNCVQALRGMPLLWTLSARGIGGVLAVGQQTVACLSLESRPVSSSARVECGSYWRKRGAMQAGGQIWQRVNADHVGQAALAWWPVSWRWTSAAVALFSAIPARQQRNLQKCRQAAAPQRDTFYRAMSAAKQSA